MEKKTLKSPISKLKQAKITTKRTSNEWKSTTHQHPQLRNFVCPQVKKIKNTRGSYFKTHHKSISLSQLSTKVMASVGTNK